MYKALFKGEESIVRFDKLINPVMHLGEEHKEEVLSL